MKKIEDLTQEEIKEMSKNELCALLRNYGVYLKNDGIDYKVEKLLESALNLKEKSVEKKKKVEEEQKVKPIAPDVPPEEAKDPVSTLFEMGYQTKEDVLRALQALRDAKKELQEEQRKVDEKIEKLAAEEILLDAKRVSVQEQCKKLEQEYKTWQEWHDKVVASKNAT